MGLDERFNVVYQYTEKAGGYNGARFIIPYKNEEDFKKNHVEKEKYKVIAKGVSEEDAQKLCEDVSLSCRLNTCVEESMRGGEIIPSLLNRELFNLGFILSHQHQNKRHT